MIYLENGLTNSTLTECSTSMVLHYCALFHILAATGSKILVQKLEARAVRVSTDRILKKKERY